MYVVLTIDESDEAEQEDEEDQRAEEDDENMVEYEDQENQEQDLQVHMGPEDCQTM